MRKAAITGTAIITLSLMLTACSGINDTETKSASSSTSGMPDAQKSNTSTASLSGAFEGLNGQNVGGNVSIEGDTVKLTGFSSDEGPDLHLYFTNGTDEAAIAKGTVIGAVAYDKATQTFMLDGVDAEDFSHVVVHCDKAKAVFGAAMIGEAMTTELTGSFMGLNGQNVGGNVSIEGDTVKLTGFSSDEGPDLHLYFTNGTDEAAIAKGTVIGAVAYDKATQTFMLDGVDAEDFSHVVVHCDKAKAVFGAAMISK